MKKKIKINPRYSQLGSFIERLPEVFEQEGNVGFLVDEVKEVVSLNSNEIEKITYNTKEDKTSLINAVGKHNGELISLFDLSAISLEGN